MVRTIESADFVDLIIGLGFSAFGAGGGRAAIWGEAESNDKDCADGTTTGC